MGGAINYIDNILLSQPGSEQSDIVYEATPFITVQADSGRMNLELYYQLQALGYSKNNSANTVYHQLYADMNLELSEELFFLDLRTTNSQSIVTSTERMPIGNLAISGNRTNVATYTVSPYISKNFSDNTSMLLRGTFTKAYYEDDFITYIDSEIENRIYNFSLSNDSETNYIGWSVGFNRSEFNTNIIPDNFYEDDSLTLTYNKSEQFIPFITVGDEKNSIDQTIMDSGGGYWNAGLEWNPTPRTSISVAKGARFYGDTSRFSWETRGRFLTIGVDYDETVTSSSILFGGQSPGQIQQGTASFAGLEDITASVFISKRFTSRITYQKSKSTISWQVYNDNRKYIATSDVLKYQGSNLSWGWRVAARTEIIFSANWNESKGQTTGVNTIKDFSIDVTRAVSSRLRTSLGYRYRNNKITYGDGFRYTQNTIYLNVTAEF